MNMEYEVFMKHVEDLTNSIDSKIKEVNPIYLMSYLNQMFIHSINDPINSRSKLPDGFIQKSHYISGILASKKLNTTFDMESCSSDEIDTILELTDELFGIYSIFWISRPSLDGSREDDRVQEYGAGLTSFISALFQPKLGSTEQFIQYIIDQFEPFDDKFFKPEIGITTRECVDIFQAILDQVSTQYTDVIKDLNNIISPLYDSWKKFSAGELTFEEAKYLHKNDPIPEEDLRENTSKFMASFIVSRDDFVDRFSSSILDAFFTLFSFEPGTINNDFRYPTDPNELSTNSFMKLEPGKYYLVEVAKCFYSLLEVLQISILNSEYALNYLRHRDQITQKKSVELLSRVFNSGTIIEEAYYGYESSMEFETDLLISYKNKLLICEVKAKTMRNPLLTGGNIKKIKRDFKDAIQAAYSQALRTQNYIMSQENAVFVDKKNRPLKTMNDSDFEDYILMIITAEQFGSLGTELRFLLDKNENDYYPFVISLFDLETLVSRLNTPERFLDYVLQRRKLHGSVYGSDELDFAGYYLRYGNLDFSKQLQKCNQIVLDGDLCSIFDEDWYEDMELK